MAQILNQQLELVPIATLRPHPENPRRGSVGDLTQSIACNGFYGALVVQRSTRFILVGNHRHDAARREGLAEIPVLWVDVDDDRARRILLVDNRANDQAGYDDVALARLLTDLRGTDWNLSGTGYSEADFDAIVKAAGDAFLSATKPAADFPAPTAPGGADGAHSGPRTGENSPNEASSDGRESAGGGGTSWGIGPCPHCGRSI